MFGQKTETTEPITDDTISIRAYQLWQDRGCPECDGAEDWQAAHQQLVAESEQSGRRQPLRRFWDRLRNRAA